MAVLREVTPNKVRARKTRLIMGRTLRHHLSAFGDDVAGFALVTWDMRGGAQSAFLTVNGMVSASLMPSFVHDVLNRHVAVDLAQREEINLVTPDDPA